MNLAKQTAIKNISTENFEFSLLQPNSILKLILTYVLRHVEQSDSNISREDAKGFVAEALLQVHNYEVKWNELKL